MRITLAQLNPIVGDIAGNTQRVLRAADAGLEAGADVMLCPELCLIGYPPRDLLLREGVIEDCEAAVKLIAEACPDLAIVVGHPRRSPEGVRGARNSASVCIGGRVRAICDKMLLPGYDVFDEDRYFDPGANTVVVELPVGRVGIAICEDLWRAHDVEAHAQYARDPLADLARAGCDVILSLNASPFVRGKFARHVEIVRKAARDARLPIVAVNQVGANDDLIFDGRSLAVTAKGDVSCASPGWEESIETIDLASPRVIDSFEPAGAIDDLFHALVLGVRDYVRKTKHSQVLLGVSGGIDSAVTACIAAAALGPEGVTGLIMPSQFSSPGSRDDARALAANLRLGRCIEVSIETAHEALRATLAEHLPGSERGVTDENVQARLRGIVLMAHANSTNALVLATGNKSELAAGYSTLYGDMCGAVSVLGDVLKRDVYNLARWMNAHHAACGFASSPIPLDSITKPPSAELRADQTDQDTLPPYDVLDELIERFIEREQSMAQIIEATGWEESFIARWTRVIDNAQFKREQAAVILKVSPRAFGRGRVMPIVVRQSQVSDAGSVDAARPAGVDATI